MYFASLMKGRWQRCGDHSFQAKFFIMETIKKETARMAVSFFMVD